MSRSEAENGGDGKDTETAAEPESTTPRADCVADSAGGLTFDVVDPGGLEAGTGAGTAGADDGRCPSHVLLFRRRVGGHTDEVRFPLMPAGEGRLRAALPSSVALAEGRWDVHVRLSGGEAVRLAPGVYDLRSLLDRVPSGARGHVAVRIPYTTRQGNLMVRSWWRAPHAEAGELLVAESGLTVRGRVYGTALDGAARAELTGRHASGPVWHTGITVAGTEFSFVVSYEALAKAAEPGIWDVWLRTAGEDGQRMRVARLLDDVADKKPIFIYPAVRLMGGSGPVEAGPYYTKANDLSVRITADRGTPTSAP